MERPPADGQPPDRELTFGLVAERRLAQELNRGPWRSPRDAERPHPPWPADDNPILWYLVEKARASIAAGTHLDEALFHLASYAWFEGGVENYDRGQWDARRAHWYE